MIWSAIKKYCSGFLNTPYKLFWFYVALNMIPSLILCFTEPLNSYGKIVLILFPLGAYMIIFSLFKNNGLLQLILFPVLFLHAFEIVLLYLFGEDVIAVDMFLNVITTNPSEAGELLDSLWPSVVFVCILYIPTTIIAIWQWRKKKYLERKYRHRFIVPGIALLISASVLSIFSVEKNTQTFTFHENVYPLNVYYNLNFAIKKWNRTNNYPITSKDFVFNASKETRAGKREIYVMVIGETSRADNWSLYGYGKETTPYMDSKEGLMHLQDAITQSNTTHKSVSIMLSDASAENYEMIYTRKSIVTAFKEAGFKTVFLSNQGQNHSFTEFFAQEADVYKDIRSIGNTGLTENHFDEDLIPLLMNSIDSLKNDDIFAVLHTYGSHFNYKERYPNGFSKFVPDNVTKISKKERDVMVNAFDNSILHTDYLLSEIMSKLEDSTYCSALFYSSDHGEDILDDKRERFLHASPNPTYYQLKIPMLMWFSDNYRNTYPQKYDNAKNNRLKPVATNSVFHTLLDIASINTPYLTNDLSLVDSTFKVRERMYLSDHDNPVPYYKMNLKKQDLEMLDKNNMHKK